MRPVRTTRSFAVRAWLAFGLASILTTSVVAAADAPGAAPLPVVPAAAQVAAPVAPVTDPDPYTDAGLDGLGRALAAEPAAVAPIEVPVASKPAAPAAKPKPASTHPSGPIVYAGRNHFWFPALGINQAVYSYPCSSSAPPGPQVYRWGCAGTNNVYLLAHAGGKFAPLHDAYVAGRLKAGMLVLYADGAGHVHYYRLEWVKVTAPLASSHWAWDPQPVSSLTLQTCLGAQSQWRIFVRFLEVPKP
ncbi:MAG TPA: hypothetical protein VMH24_07530 [Candidatus Sulfotelmatobacter sp.]|nr:hypothetical protein [Candidatus Sulfotelmatobacter sp.]